jgi:hypothetical protein
MCMCVCVWVGGWVGVCARVCVFCKCTPPNPPTGKDRFQTGDDNRRATPRYTPQAPRGQLYPLPKKSLTKLLGPEVDFVVYPAGPHPQGGHPLQPYTG